jgi:hypothetical protein
MLAISARDTAARADTGAVATEKRSTQAKRRRKGRGVVIGEGITSLRDSIPSPTPVPLSPVARHDVAHG